MISLAETDAPSREGLRALLAHLRAADYAFVTPTPATHRRVIGRPEKARACDLRDIFGWSLPFDGDRLPADLLRTLQDAGVVREEAGGLRSIVRVSRLGGDLFLHSAFPPEGETAVFFGPDTYRFARFLQSCSDGRPIGLAVDVGVGSGAGAMTVVRGFRPQRLLATDVNPAALRLAAINLEVAGVAVDLRLTDGLEGVPGGADLIVANPPFIAGDGDRAYRDGGQELGAQVSVDWAMSAAGRLAPGGRVLLYTGSAIVAGRDGLRQMLEERLDPTRFALGYSEIDPDIFGGQLGARAYRQVERIAAVGAVITRRPD